MIEEETFTNLTLKVKFLFFRNNKIKTIKANAFRMMPALLELDISSCLLVTSSLQPGSFSNLSALRSLHIENNSFLSYPDDEISRLESLMNLTIDIFPGFHFGDKFWKLRVLGRVTFIPHGLLSLSNASFQGLRQSPIRYLDVNFYNHIDNFCEGLPQDLLCSFPHLQGLSISFGMSCGIKRVLQTLKCLEGKHLDYFISSDNHDLNSNDPVILNETDVEYLRNMCIRKLILRNNDIAGIDFKLPLQTFQSCLEEVDLSSNNILFSSSHHLWLTLLLFTPNIQVIKICCQNTQSSRDFSWNSRRYETKRKGKDDFKIILPETLRYLDISNAGEISTTEMDVFIQAAQLKFLNASGTEFSVSHSLTLDFPLLTVMDVSYAETNTEVLSLQKLVSLKSLMAVKSGFIVAPRNRYGNHRVREGTLHGLHNLRYVDLSDNGVTKLPSFFFASQKNSNITIIMDRNKFGSNFPIALYTLNSIDTLSMRECFERYYIPEEIFESFLHLHVSTLYLEAEIIGCYCYRKDALEMLWKIREKIADLDKMTCDDFYEEPKNLQELFSTQQWRKFRLQCGVNDFWLTFSIALLVSAIVIILIAAIVYRVVSRGMMKNCDEKIRTLGLKIRNIYRECTRRKGYKYTRVQTEEIDVTEQTNNDVEVRSTVFSPNETMDGTKKSCEKSESEI
jgi:hypothetical protein